MGTRSLTVFEDEGKEICVLYRQMDGYPEGHGMELKEFLSDMTVVNGISLAEKRRIANGMSCLCAQVIAHFKTEVGRFYVHSAKTRDVREDYIYTLSEEGGAVHLKIQEGWSKAKMDTVYKGPIAEFDAERLENKS